MRRWLLFATRGVPLTPHAPNVAAEGPLILNCQLARSLAVGRTSAGAAAERLFRIEPDGLVEREGASAWM